MGRYEDLMERLKARRAEREANNMFPGSYDKPDHELLREVSELLGSLAGAHLLMLGVNAANRFPRQVYEHVTPEEVMIRLDTTKSYVRRKSPLWMESEERYKLMGLGSDDLEGEDGDVAF